MQHLNDLITDQPKLDEANPYDKSSSLDFLRPFLGHLVKVCLGAEQQLDTMQMFPQEAKVSVELKNKFDSRRQKRLLNFEKFRKEVKSLTKNYYSAKLRKQASEL